MNLGGHFGFYSTAIYMEFDDWGTTNPLGIIFYGCHSYWRMPVIGLSSCTHYHRVCPFLSQSTSHSLTTRRLRLIVGLIRVPRCQHRPQFPWPYACSSTPTLRTILVLRMRPCSHPQSDVIPRLSMYPLSLDEGSPPILPPGFPSPIFNHRPCVLALGKRLLRDGYRQFAMSLTSLST